MKNKLFQKNVNIEKYTKEFTKFSHKMDVEERKYFSKVNKVFNSNFNVLNGLNDVYEWYTGAVYFKDYEWNELSDSTIKKVFSKKINDLYSYILFLDDGVILRGADIYYFFLTYVSRFKPTVKSDILKWVDNSRIFLSEIKNALSDFKIINNYDIRLLLGVIDNIRNIILLLFNCELLMDNNENNFIICDSYVNEVISSYIDLIERYQNIIYKCCFERPLSDSIVEEVSSLVIKIESLFESSIQNILKTNSSYIFNKGFNRLRENDNYFENYYTCKYVFSKLKNKLLDNDINLVAPMYGALELPFIVKNSNIIKNKISIGLLNQEEGNYFVKQQNSEKNVKKSLNIKGDLLKSNITYVIDDNLMSGVTSQFAIDLLEINGFDNIKGVIGIRRPTLYRIPQLIHYNNYLNISLYNKKIYGLLTKSSYTRIKENTNYGDRFSNELNICSIQSEIFLKALYNNNSFIKDSEVDIFSGFNDGVKL